MRVSSSSAVIVSRASFGSARSLQRLPLVYTSQCAPRCSYALPCIDKLLQTAARECATHTQPRAFPSESYEGTHHAPGYRICRQQICTDSLACGVIPFCTANYVSNLFGR
jgi:hypothetical protein